MLLVSCFEDASDGNMGGNWFPVSSAERIDVDHHACGPVDNTKVVSKEFLRPPLDHGDISTVFQDFLYGGTIAHPVEVCAPEVSPILSDGPSSTSDFTNERVKTAFN